MSTLSTWEQARFRFFQARIRHLTQNERWTDALTALIDLAGWLTGRTEDSKTWLELLITATKIASHLDDPAEYRAFLAHFGERFLTTSELPSNLIRAIASIADEVDQPIMVAVGRWLTDARQGWPLGPYLMAHFASPDTPPEEIARLFARAENRAARANLPEWGRHARLRRGALLILSGADPAKGRELLHTLDWSALFPTEQLWMAVALSGSAHWADRLRAMDIILDLHQALQSARPLAGDLQLEDLKQAAGAVFQLAGLHLPEAEERRLLQLVGTLFTGAEREQWTSYLQARRELSRICTLPFDQARDANSLLQKLSALYPEKWRAPAQHFGILQAAVTGNFESDHATPAILHDRRLPVADATAALLQGIKNKRNIEEGLQYLNQALAELEPDRDSAIARQISLIWAALLDKGSAIDLQPLQPLLIELATHHTELATPPSFGWWLLSAHLFQAELPQVAQIIAERALTTSSDDDTDPYRPFVTHQILKEAIANQDLPTTERWLFDL